MALVKLNDAGVTRLVNQISELRAYRNRLSVLSKLRNSEYWQIVKDHLALISRGADAEIKNVLAREDANQESDWATCKKLVGRIQAVETLIDEVEGSEQKASEANGRIQTLSEQLDRYREELDGQKA